MCKKRSELNKYQNCFPYKKNINANLLIFACILGKLTQYETVFPLYKYANRLTNTKHYIFIFKKKLEIFCKYHKISEHI